MAHCRWQSIALALTCLMTLSACATSRSEVAVPSQSSKQLETGMAIVVPPPVDGRKFETAPRDPSIPSLKEPAQINDSQITARALGRKRNGYGMAMGDVLLNPPQTAASLVADAVKAGLRDSGYRIVDAGDPAYASAPKVNVQIGEFWTWITPGFGSIKLDNKTTLVIESSLPGLSPPATVQVHETKGYFVIAESEWAPFIDNALVKVRERVHLLTTQKTAMQR